MYNRYIRNDRGVYTRIPQEDGPSSARPSPGAGPPPGGNPPPGAPPNGPGAPPPPPPRPEHHRPPEGGGDGLTGILRHFLDQLHLDHVDTGDLLLLGLLFLLFREDADEELLVALGLLLIL